MISIVIPIYNAEKSIYKLTEKIYEIFKDIEIEIILVNDNSLDDSHNECVKILSKFNKTTTYLKLGKNMGEHNALMAGLNYAKGDWVIAMDDDFQNPPEEALKLYNYSKNNKFDVVYGDYQEKKTSFF